MTALVPSSFAAPSGGEGLVSSVGAARPGSLVALRGVITGVGVSVSTLTVTVSDGAGSVSIHVPSEVWRGLGRDAFGLGLVMSLVGCKQAGFVFAVRVAFDGVVGS
ncbi:hypothetical protein [Streptomyces yunnanensis]|uniref:Uncharacterized protein n=1 Tax=Streptomyces yunnanensis TaxID=156453 RepID=A0A9X8MT79_9ACTN|nr:hypothetical protein [Streptomyces yunnanensis]SHL74581.1 hypothetical protein SAMN05216268_10655 [Streptomyces yunnanensis]